MRETMMDHQPITSVLRKRMRRYQKYNDLAVQHVELPADEFDAICDNIDMLHSLLEAENERMHERLDGYESVNKVTVNVKMRIDWESMAEELESAADAIRELEGDDE